MEYLLEHRVFFFIVFLGGAIAIASIPILWKHGLGEEAPREERYPKSVVQEEKSDLPSKAEGRWQRYLNWVLMVIVVITIVIWKFLDH